MFKYSYLFLFFCLFLNACKSGDTTNTKGSDTHKMELIVQENYSGYEEEQFFVIKDQKSLSSFYGTVNRTRKPGLTPPMVDFSKEMLLVWCGGEKVFSQVDLELSSKEDSLVVHKIKPRISKKQESAVVSPFRIYKLPVSSKTLKFQ